MCTHIGLGKLCGSNTPHWSWQLVNHPHPFLMSLTKPSSELQTLALLWWRGKATTCPPISLFLKCHYSCTHFTAVTHCLRCGVIQTTGHSVGKDCLCEAATEMGFPLSVRVKNWFHGAEKKRRRKRNATMLRPLFIRAFQELGISKFFKVRNFSVENRSNFSLATEDMLSLIWNLWKTIWLFKLVSASLPK